MAPPTVVHDVIRHQVAAGRITAHRVLSPT
jgi:hypothetical protein